MILVLVAILEGAIQHGAGWLAQHLAGGIGALLETVHTALSIIQPWHLLMLAAGAAIPFVGDRTAGLLRARYGPRLRRISGQTFSSVTVRLDGKNLENCTFNNVTFRWDGGPFSFSGTINGAVRFETRSSTIKQTVDVLKALQLLGGSRGQEFADSWTSLTREYFDATDQRA